MQWRYLQSLLKMDQNRILVDCWSEVHVNAWYQQSKPTTVSKNLLLDIRWVLSKECQSENLCELENKKTNPTKLERLHTGLKPQTSNHATPRCSSLELH